MSCLWGCSTDIYVYATYGLSTLSGIHAGINAAWGRMQQSGYVWRPQAWHAYIQRTHATV